VELLVWFKEHVQEWKRINRIPRDIPNQVLRVASPPASRT
jgi:histone acetyltransferase (RNA polymerase elongator complex component)